MNDITSRKIINSLSDKQLDELKYSRREYLEIQDAFESKRSELMRYKSKCQQLGRQIFDLLDEHHKLKTKWYVKFFQFLNL